MLDMVDGTHFLAPVTHVLLPSSSTSGNELGRQISSSTLLSSCLGHQCITGTLVRCDKNEKGCWESKMQHHFKEGRSVAHVRCADWIIAEADMKWEQKLWFIGPDGLYSMLYSTGSEILGAEAHDHRARWPIFQCSTQNEIKFWEQKLMEGQMASVLSLTWASSTGHTPGIEMLSLRAQRHSENALVLAQLLSKYEMITWVSHLGLEGSPPKDLVIHPAMTMHQQLSEEQLSWRVTHDLIQACDTYDDVF
ncbi:hypothetical protein DFH29DRAFT_875732 [Suillus ampliporus]|nr:hypothetical protein DFH29DRAFT_875732 [Suillus ampliporus]